MGQGVDVVSVSGAAVVVTSSGSLAMDMLVESDMDMESDMDKLVDSDMESDDEREATSSTTSSSASLFNFRRNVFSFLLF